MADTRTSNGDGLVVGCYLIGTPDPQHHTARDGNPDYVRDWLQSIARLGMRAQLFHDALPAAVVERIESTYPCRCVRADRPGKSGIDDRWAIYSGWLERGAAAGKVFFTDVSDVVCLACPWPSVEPGAIYIGSESPDETWSLGWVEARADDLARRGAIDADIWGRRFRRHRGLVLNPGLLGGSPESVGPFISAMADLLDKVDYKHETYDMVAANYLEPAAGTRFVTGDPVHTVFRAFQRDRDDCWFAHK